jgi:hypothetical protein
LSFLGLALGFCDSIKRGERFLESLVVFLVASVLRGAALGFAL